MLVRHRERLPKVDSSSFVEESSRVIGDVEIGPDSSVWFNAVLRGDVNYIRVGSKTNIQDGTVVHVTRAKHPTVIGNEVTIGHNATVHGCTIEDRCLIGMGAVILDGAVIGSESMVAAGAVVAPGTVVPPRTLVIGSPAKVKRPLSEQEIAHLKTSAEQYADYAREYMSQE